MGTYTVTLDEAQEHALAYAQEVHTASWHPDVPEGTAPLPPPSVEQMSQVLVDADLANRLREMDAVAAHTVPALQPITDPALQEQVLQSMVKSPAIQDYIRSKL